MYAVADWVVTPLLSWRYQWLRLRMILNTNLVFFKWSCTPLLPLSDKGLWRIFQIWGFFLKKFIFTYLSIFELIKKVLYWISPYFLEVRNLDCFLPSWYSLILNTLSQCHCSAEELSISTMQFEVNYLPVRYSYYWTFTYATLVACFIHRLY